MPKRHDPIAAQTGRILREIREEKNPSVNTLYRLIRGIGAPSDRIFYPELFEQRSEPEEILRLLTSCTPNQRKLILAFIKMLLDSQNDIDI